MFPPSHLLMLFHAVHCFAQRGSNKVDKKCTLTIDANGGNFSDGSTTCLIQFPYKFHISFASDVPQPTRAGYKLSGWSWYGDNIPGMRITINTKIKAIWEPIN